MDNNSDRLRELKSQIGTEVHAPQTFTPEIWAAARAMNEQAWEIGARFNAGTLSQAGYEAALIQLTGNVPLEVLRAAQSVSQVMTAAMLRGQGLADA
jgi:hypothetical protein